MALGSRSRFRPFLKFQIPFWLCWRGNFLFFVFVALTPSAREGPPRELGEATAPRAAELISAFDRHLHRILPSSSSSATTMMLTTRTRTTTTTTRAAVCLEGARCESGGHRSRPRNAAFQTGRRFAAMPRIRSGSIRSAGGSSVSSVACAAGSGSPAGVLCSS